MPIEASSRHYQGPEQTAAPAVSMPPAAELLKTTTSAQDDVRRWLQEPDAVQFEHWFQAFLDKSGKPESYEKFREFAAQAFRAGIDSVRASMVASVKTITPLEGTPESRTLIAALTFFKEQVLLQQPEEVLSGEWLGAKDVDALITAIRKRS